MIQILELVNLVMEQAKHPKADPSGSQHTDTTSCLLLQYLQA